MLGGSRPKWTKRAANFEAVTEMNIECDNKHQHLPCGKTLDDEGKTVYATSLEAQYPRKFCLSLVQCVVRQLQMQNIQIPPDSLFAAEDEKMFEMQTARVAAQGQSKKSKVPPLIPDSFAIGVFYVPQPSDVPCSLQSKLSSALKAYTVTGEVAAIPHFASNFHYVPIFSTRGRANW